MKNRYSILFLGCLFMPAIIWACDFHQQPMFGWGGAGHLPVLQKNKRQVFVVTNNKVPKVELNQLAEVDINYQSVQQYQDASIQLKASKNIQLISEANIPLVASEGSHKLVFKVLKKGYSYIQVLVVSERLGSLHTDRKTIPIPLVSANVTQLAARGKP